MIFITVFFFAIFANCDLINAYPATTNFKISIQIITLPSNTQAPIINRWELNAKIYNFLTDPYNMHFRKYTKQTIIKLYYFKYFAKNSDNLSNGIASFPPPSYKSV